MKEEHSVSLRKFWERWKRPPEGQIVLTYSGNPHGFTYLIKACCRIILRKPGWPLIKIGDKTFTKDEALKLLQ